MAPPFAVAVVDTGPLIALASIHRVSVLDALFEVVAVPFDVWGELNHRPDAVEAPQVASLENLRFEPPTPVVDIELSALDVGERQVIAVALARFPHGVVLLDEKRGRALADQRGLVVAGTLRVLVEAKRVGLVQTVKPLFDELSDRGFHVHPSIVQPMLAAAGEA